MRKTLLFLLAACCLSVAGCAKKDALSGMSPESALVSVDGEVVMTVQDFERSLIEQEVSHETKGTERKKEAELFKEKAGLRILSYYAERYGLSTDEAFLQEEYDAHIVEIEDTDVYGQEKAFFDELQQALGMDDEQYKAWNVAENLIQYNVANLLDDIVDTYKAITDPVYMEEVTLENLYALVNDAEIVISYPGVSKDDLRFENLLSL